MCGIAVVFFFNDTAPTESHALSLHDAVRSSQLGAHPGRPGGLVPAAELAEHLDGERDGPLLVLVEQGEEGLGRSEEHTSELQSRQYLVCRLLLEKKHTFLPRCVHRNLNTTGP